MTPFERHLQAAQGFLDLGLPLDAHEELEEIEPELRHFSEVLVLKVPIFQALEKWALMEVVAKELCIRHPGEPNWLLSAAWGRVANAVRLDPGFRERAQDDPDLRPLRDSMWMARASPRADRLLPRVHRPLQRFPRDHPSPKRATGGCSG